MSSVNVGAFDSGTRSLRITEGVTTENTLPPEMLVMILSHVRGADAIVTARVNRRWRAISYDSLLCNRVEGIMILLKNAMEERRLAAQEGRAVAFSRAYHIEKKCRGVFLGASSALFIKKAREDLPARHLQTLIKVANTSSGCSIKNDLFELIAVGALRGGKFNEARQAITLIKDTRLSAPTSGIMFAFPSDALDSNYSGGLYFEDLGKALIEFNKIHTKEGGAEEDRIIGDMLHDFDSPVYKDRVHLSIAKALARVGSFELAAVHASLARLRSFEKDIALAEIAELAAQAGHIDLAAEQIEAIGRYDYRRLALTRVIEGAESFAGEAVQAGDLGLAMECKNLMISKGWKWDANVLHSDIALLAAKVGRFDIARAEAEDISKYSYKNVTFKLISGEATKFAEEAVKSGNFETAVESIGFITDFWWKERTCEEAVKKAARVGDFKAAIVFIGLMPYDWRKEWAYQEVVKEATKVGDFKVVIECIDLMPYGQEKEWACQEVVRKAAKVGDFKVAIEFIGLIPSDFRRDKVCGEVVKEATKAGDFKAAIEFVGFITCSWSKEVVCREFAKEVAKAGDIEVVLTSARAIGEGNHKLYHAFCHSAACEAAEAGKLALARQLTDEIDYRQIISCFTDKTQAYRSLVSCFVFKATIDQILESVDSPSDTSVVVTVIEILMDAKRVLDAEKAVESLPVGLEKDAALKCLIEHLAKCTPRSAKVVLEKNRRLFADKSVEKQCEAVVKANLPWETPYLNIFIFIFMNLSVLVLSKLLDAQGDS